MKSAFVDLPASILVRDHLFLGCVHPVSLQWLNEQQDQTASEIHEELGRPPVFILDLRPVTYPLLVIANHEVAEQVSRVSTLFPWSTTKSPTIKEHEPLLGTDSLFLVDGEEWKGLRKRFNPGFAHSHLITLLPLIMDKTWEFHEAP